MEMDTKAENKQMIYISGFPSVQIHYFSKGLILDKEGEVLSLKLRDFLS